MMFDPYHKWLGIPRDQRPPTHYQLLGLAPGETDAEVIEEAVIRQTAHLRAYQIGPHAADCTRILNEIAKARTTLLDPAKRRQYDQQIAPKKSSTEVTALPAAPKASPFDQLDSANGPANLVSVQRSSKSGAGLLIGLGAAAVLSVAAIIVVVLVMKRGDEGPKPVVHKSPEEKPRPKPADDKPKPIEEKKNNDDLPPPLGNDPRDRVLARADVYWNLGYGGKGSSHPLKIIGDVDLRQPATGPGGRSGAKVARLAKGYFDAGQAFVAQGEALTLLIRVRDPQAIWNHAIFARRRGAEGPDINFNLAAADNVILFEMTTDKDNFMLRMPLDRIDARAWHDLLVRYDGEWLQLWCDGALQAEAPCTGAIKSTSAPVLIGAATEGDRIDFFFTGEMEEAALWKRPLDDAELLSLFRRPQLTRAVPDRPTPGGGLVEVTAGEVYRNGREATFVRFSPDGRYAFFQQPRGISVWDVAESKEVRVLSIPRNALLHLGTVAPDGKHLAAKTAGGTVVLWDIENSKWLREMQHGKPLSGIAFSTDSKTLATAGRSNGNNTIQLVSVETGSSSRILRPFANPVVSFAFNDDNLFAVDVTRTFHRYELSSDLFRRQMQLTSFAPLVRFSPDLKLMTFLKSGRVSQWDLVEDKELRGADLPPDVQPVASVLDVTADGRMAMVALANPHRLLLLEMTKGMLLKTLDGHQQTIRAAALSPDGKRAISMDQDKVMRIWKLDDVAAQIAVVKPEMKPETKAETKIEAKLDPKFIPAWESIKCPSYASIAITPDGKRAVTAGPGVDLWDLTTGTLLKNLLIAGEGAFGSVALSPDGSQALTLSGDNALRVWDLSTGRLLRSRGYATTVRPNCVAWAATGQYAAFGGKSLYLIDPETLATKHTVSGSKDGDVLTASFIRDGSRIVFGHESGAIRVVPTMGTGAKTVFGHAQGSFVNQLITTSASVISVGQDKMLRIWDMKTLRERDHFEHKANVRAVAVSPFVTFAVTGGDDKKIRFWNLKTSRIVSVLPGPEGIVRALAFSPNAQFFLSTSDDGTLRAWRLPKEVGGK